MATILLDELDLLKDIKMLDYLLKNVSLVSTHFNIPKGETPRQFLLRISNALSDVIATDVESKKERVYTTKPIFASREVNCPFCKSMLDVKKHLNVNLYDDVLGSSIITLLTKCCNSCKLTYYPGFFESFKEKNDGTILIGIHMVFLCRHTVRHSALIYLID